MFKLLAGLFFLGLSAYSLYNTYKTFQFTKEKGGKTTSPFILNALTFSLIFGLALLGLGVSILFNLL